MSSQYIPLPFRDPRLLRFDTRWLNISSTLKDLRDKCEIANYQGWTFVERKYGSPRRWLRQAIIKYNRKAEEECNFGVVQKDEEISEWLIQALPWIIDNALSLPGRLHKPIPILKHDTNEVVRLERNVICSLIANAFMSTFPDRKNSDLPSINFWRLFNEDPKDSVRTTVKRQKLKCILEYFRRMGGNGNILPNTIITYERFHSSENVLWANSLEKLSEVRVILTDNSRIEDADGMLQVDFANNMVGGGILSDGAVQEEIRFCINPELIVARLFTERLSCNDVLIVTGTRQFSSYTGYGSSFKFQEMTQFSLHQELDDEGREPTQIVAMDAIHFPRNKSHKQYKQRLIDRELHKSYIAFRPGKTTPVATGNWGCGAFNGDPELKFLLQWMAASENNQRRVLYHAPDNDQRQAFEKMANFLISKDVNVGKLYSVLLEYKQDVFELRIQNERLVSWKNMPVFNYIEGRIRHEIP